MSQALVATYKGATNTNPGRIVVRAEGPTRIVHYWNYTGLEQEYATAFLKFLRKMEWRGVWVMGSTRTGYVAVKAKPLANGAKVYSDGKLYAHSRF